MGKICKKHFTIMTLFIATVLATVFIVAEIPMSGLDYIELTFCDGMLRFIIGVVAIFVFRALDKDACKRIFTQKVPAGVGVILIPFAAALGIYVLIFALADGKTSAYTSDFFLNWITQFTTGFWEEMVCRGIFMLGLLGIFKRTVKGRLFTVVVSGLFFGLLHFSSLFFGTTLEGAFDLFLATFCWGMYVAAVYMYSGNIVLVMIMHTVWDIVVRIPDYFLKAYPDIPLLYYCDTILRFLIFPITAICICVFAFKKETVSSEK